MPLPELIAAASALHAESDPLAPFTVLAKLPLPIFITTNADNLLALALQRAGKAPEVEFCPWNETMEEIKTIFVREPDYQPSVARPLVWCSVCLA